MGWYKIKDGSLNFKKGRYRVLKIYKRPHGKYCCSVWNKGKCVAAEGYFGTYLSSLVKAKKYGIEKAKELNLI